MPILQLEELQYLLHLKQNHMKKQRNERVCQLCVKQMPMKSVLQLSHWKLKRENDIENGSLQKSNSSVTNYNKYSYIPLLE